MIIYTLSPNIFVKFSLPNARHLTSVSALTVAPLVDFSYSAYSLSKYFCYPKLSFAPIFLINFSPFKICTCPLLIT